MSWLHLPSVTATQGSITVTVNNAFETEHVQVGDALLIGQFAPVEIVGVHSSQLTLRDAWPNATQTAQAGAVIPTAADFQLAAHLLREATTITHGNFAQMEKWWTEDVEVVFRGYDGVEHRVPSAQKMSVKVDAVLNPLKALIVDIGNLQHVAQSAIDAQHASEGARDRAIQAETSTTNSKNAASTSEGNAAASAHSSEQYKSEAQAARDAAIGAKDVAEALASPFINGGEFTPSVSQEYPTLPAHGTVVVFVITHTDPGAPYQFTTGGLKGKSIDDDDYLIAFRFAPGDIRWSIMQLGSGAVMAVNGKSGSRISITKDDIGLEHVNNWQATASLDDPSTTKYVVAKAIYDLHQLIGQKWTFDQQAIDNRVTTVGAQNFAGKNGSTTEQFGVPKVPSSDNSATSKAYVDGRHPNESLLINADFSVWQDGKTLTNHVSGKHSADMWRTTFNQGGGNVYRAASNKQDTVAFDGSRYGIAVDTFTGGVSTYEHTQRIESLRCQKLKQGTPVTISFYVFTTDGNPVDVAGRIWRANDFDDWSVQHDMTVGPTKTIGSGDRYVATINIPNNNFLLGMQVGIGIYQINSGQTVAIYDAKVEPYPHATDCVHDRPSFNLASCQRYYEKGAVYQETYGQANQSISITAQYKVTKRIAANVTMTDVGSVFTDKSWSVSSASNITVANSFRCITRKDASTGPYLCQAVWVADARL